VDIFKIIIGTCLCICGGGLLLGGLLDKEDRQTVVLTLICVALISVGVLLFII
jgi:hypothetical protein